MLAGFYNQYFDRYTRLDGSQSYTEMWWTHAAVAVASLIVLALAFPDRSRDPGRPTGYTQAISEGDVPGEPVVPQARR